MNEPRRTQIEEAAVRRFKQIARHAINGRRGAFQALFAVSYFALGFSYVFASPSPSRERSLSWIAELIPLDVLGVLWLVCGLAGLWGSRMPRPTDKWSFIALTVAPTAWGFLYVGAVVFQTNPDGWVTSVLYWCIAGAVMVVSGMTGDQDRDERETQVVAP